MLRGQALAAVVILLAAGGTAPAASSVLAQAPRVNADAKTMADFEARVNAYAALHRKLEATLPDLPKEATPQQISAHQVPLARMIARARSGAKAGDIFTKDTRALFRRYLVRVFQGREGAELKALIMDENPGKLRLQVNGPYPESVPLSTVPPQVLQALPKLPEDLQYRFIGDRLVLVDVHANTIVDVIEDAIPH
jgi:hypothetical protein